MTDGFLFIGGCPRSGTTALLQLLNSDPQVYISSEENVFKIIQSLEGLLDSRGRRARKMRGKMRELSPRETLTMDNIHRYNMDVSTVWPTMRFIYEHHHQQIHPGSPLKVWGDKLPGYAQDIPKVLSLPDVCYLHITRNPFDVVNSMLRRTEAARQGKDWWKSITKFDEMVEIWAESYRAIEKFEGQSNVLHLHYEQLVFDFQQSSEQICRFLQSDLHFEKLLVDSLELHYDRPFLSVDLARRISEHPAVADYARRYARSSEAPQVAQSLSMVAQAGRWVHTSEPLDVNSKPRMSSDPIKVFVGCTPGEWLPMRVLEYTIRSATKRNVDLVPLYTISRSIPTPAALTNRPRTPFSFQRFLIPELCNYQGRAIYLDADMLVFADISDLWEQPFKGYDVLTTSAAIDGRRGQFSVMVLDCSALKWKVEDIVKELDAGTLDYASLMYDMQVARHIGHLLPSEWNSLEQYELNKTRLLHYTDMNKQPWTNSTNSLAHLWVACLRNAVKDEFIKIEEIKKEVALGHIRPSLLEEVDSDYGLTGTINKTVKHLDKYFIPPYKKLIYRRPIDFINQIYSKRNSINSVLFKLNKFLKLK